MDRSKIVAVITGIISLVLAIAYLLVVQIIDFRGEMLPAPILETIIPESFTLLIKNTIHYSLFTHYSRYLILH